MCKLWIEGSPAPLGQFKLVDAVALAPRSRHLKHEVKVRLILDRRMNLGKDNSLWRHLCLIGERTWQAGAGIYGSIRPAWCSASLHLLLPTLKYSVFMKHPSAHVPELIILWDGMELILRISLDFKQYLWLSLAIPSYLWISLIIYIKYQISGCKKKQERASYCYFQTF